MKKHVFFLLALWTGVVITLFVFDLRHLNESVREMAIGEARASLKMDKAIRLWVASHGGVYVPVTAKTPPNPFLDHIPERDIRTPGGKMLTLMNPAYFIRQIQDEYAKLYGIRGHITSLKPLRPETAPDAWERSALKAFEGGRREAIEFTQLDGQPYLRLMTPLSAEAQCLGCHAEQGYKVGDVRGGVSVSVPMRLYLNYRNRDLRAHLFSYGVLWIVGCAGIGFAMQNLSWMMKTRDQAEARLRAAKESYQTLIENALMGVYVSQDNTIKFCNSRFARIHGYGDQDLTGMNSIDFVHPLDRPMVTDLNKRRYQGQSAPEEYEVRCIMKDGKTIWVKRRNTLIRHDDRPAILVNEVDVSDQRKAEEALKASEAQLKRLVSRLLQHQEAERKTIALEIHEDIAQSLSAIKLRVESILAESQDPPASFSATMAPIIEDIKKTIGVIRQLTKRLSPIMLDELGLGPAIEALCREVGEEVSGTHIDMEIELDESRISPELKIVIYRVLEEILTICTLNRKAEYINIVLGLHADSVLLTVTESGLSVPRIPCLPARQPEAELTVAALKSRAESYGGSFNIESEATGESTITAAWPLASNSLHREAGNETIKKY